MTSLKQLLRKPPSHLRHTAQILKHARLQTPHQSRRHTCEIRLERTILMIEFLIIHILGPVKKHSRRDLRQQTRRRKHLHDLLLQSGQQVVFRQGKEFVDLGDTSDGGGFGLVELELVFVEVLEHLFEGDGVVFHEGDEIAFRGAFARFGLLDLFVEFGGADEDGFVGVELVAVLSEHDDEDCGGEVPGKWSC